MKVLCEYKLAAVRRQAKGTLWGAFFVESAWGFRYEPYIFKKGLVFIAVPGLQLNMCFLESKEPI